MTKAIDLAQKGTGATSPNPIVGSVIVKNRRLVGAGYHARAGSDHAEIVAIRAARNKVHGVTL